MSLVRDNTKTLEVLSNTFASNWFLDNSDTYEFEVMYRRMQPALVSFAIYHIGSEPDAVELVNDVFVNVWNKRKTLELNEELNSYLFTSVKNKCINFYKKKKLQTDELSKAVHINADENSSDRIELKDKVNELQAILASIPPKCKQVFLMSRLNGLKNKEIAELLDISIKTVENQMTKALKIFKNNLK